MRVFVAGATGATGKLVVEQLLERGYEVIAIVRSFERIPENIRKNTDLSIKKASLLDLSDEEIAVYVKGCDAVISCLGHNLNLRGIYGKPRKLVTEAVERLCYAVRKSNPDKPVKFVLMNTTANINLDLKEKISFGQKIVLSIIRMLIPPQIDNEKAADYLRLNIGQNDELIEWVSVRPDALIDMDRVSEYELHVSPIRSAVFNPGKTSRINVAHFMAELIDNQNTWDCWKGKMPVIYNVER